MTREEEEINQASGAYAFQLCAECINSEICKEMGLGCPRLRESIIAFSEGVKWADEHPKNIWHDSSEGPQGEDWLILFEGEKGNYWVQSKDGVIFFHNTWKEYVRTEMVARWAYIDELTKK